jgi:hypothetical protein
MNMKSMPWKAGLIGLSLGGILAACVVGEGGYDGGVGVGYVGGYYAPSGYEYGGWGRGYHVAPPRGDDRHAGDRDSHAGGGGHAPPGGEGHGAPRGGGHAPPSIPSRPRGH